MNTSFELLKKEYYTYLLCIIIFLLPYSISTTNLFVIVLGLIWLWDLVTQKHLPVLKENFRYVLPFVLLFLAYLVSVLYSSDTREALSTLERRIPILLLPLILFSTPFKRKSIETIFLAFVLSIAASCLVASTLTTHYFLNNPAEYYLEKALWYLPQTIGFHAPYLALYLVVSNVLCFYFFLQKKQRALVLVIFLTNNIFLFLISSRSALAVNWLYIAGLSSYYLIKKKGMLVALLNLLLITGICYVAIANVPYLHTKISKLTEAAYGVNHRVIAAGAASEVIIDNPLIGVGIGDIQAELNKELPDMTYADINVHNQYLHELMTYGIIGFSFFVSIFIIGFRKAFAHQDLFFSLFLISFLFAFLTEVILARYLGIMLFSLFYPLFLNLHINEHRQELPGNAGGLKRGR